MIRRILKYILIFFGCLFLFLFVFCFTSGPFWTWYRLSTKYAGIHRPPGVIVILGGGGMPSESGLMRCWYGAKAANYFYNAKVIVALPGDTTDSLSSVNLMKKELVLRGVLAERISFEAAGTNTRAEAKNVFNGISNIDQRSLKFEGNIVTKSQSHRVTEKSSAKCQVQKESQSHRVTEKSSAKCQVQKESQSHKVTESQGDQGQSAKVAILIISSPEHMYRAVLAFRKVGFARVDGLPAFENAIESGLAFDDRLLGGKSWMPGIGKNITLRYRFWTQMHYEQLIIREWVAIAYYWLNGWI